MGRNEDSIKGNNPGYRGRSTWNTAHGRPGTEAADGRRRFQEHTSSQRDERQRIYGDDGLFFRLHASELCRLPHQGKQRQLGKVRGRNPSQADRAENGRHDAWHQSGVLRGTSGRHMLHLPSRRRTPQGRSRPDGNVFHTPSSRAGSDSEKGGGGAFGRLV